MRKLEIPGDRDLPPGHFEARRDHLINEARANPASRRRRSRRLKRSGETPGLIANWRRTAASAAVLIAIAVGTFFAVDRTTDGTSPAAAAVRVTVAPFKPGGAAASPSSSLDVLVNVSRSIQARMQNEDAEIVGGSAEQRDLLRTILSRMPDNSLTRVAIVSKVYRGETGVALEITALSDDFPRSDWEKMLLSGAFRALSADRGLTQVVGLPSPQTGYSPSAAGTVTDVEARIRAAAIDAGAEVVQLQVYQPDGIAPAVVLKVDDPAPFLKHRAEAFLEAIGDLWLDYEGTFVEVVDSNGTFVWETTTNSLASEGSVGTRPDLVSCQPVPVFGNLSSIETQPPCPVS